MQALLYRFCLNLHFIDFLVNREKSESSLDANPPLDAKKALLSSLEIGKVKDDGTDSSSSEDVLFLKYKSIWAQVCSFSETIGTLATADFDSPDDFSSGT